MLYLFVFYFSSTPYYTQILFLNLCLAPLLVGLQDYIEVPMPNWVNYIPSKWSTLYIISQAPNKTCFSLRWHRELKRLLSLPQLKPKPTVTPHPLFKDPKFCGQGSNTNILREVIQEQQTWPLCHNYIPSEAVTKTEDNNTLVFVVMSCQQAPNETYCEEALWHRRSQGQHPNQTW